MAFRNRFVTRYLNPLEVEDEFRTLVGLFPSLCELTELPYLTHGYEGDRLEAHGRHHMHVLRITSPQGTNPKPAVLLMRSPHAREWVNSLAVLETARQLLENYRPADSDPHVQSVVTTLDHAEVFIVPEGNPDGARYSFFDPGQRMWRKNLRPPRGSDHCPGVDCNRNYSRYFGAAGSSGATCSDVYRGPRALSEPETANIDHLVTQHRNIVFAIDSHSSGQAIFRPNPSGGTFVSSLPVSAQDHATYSRLEELMNAEIRSVQGVEYRTGTTSNHAGTSDEHFFFNHHIFGFDLECAQQFQPPIEQAVTAALEVAAATRALGWCAARQTDVDIDPLLKRRQESDQKSTASPDLLDRFWKADSAPLQRWRRFEVSVTCERQSSIDVASQLLHGGYDLIHVESRFCEVVASAEDLVQLLNDGYEVQLIRDVYSEREE